MAGVGASGDARDVQAAPTTRRPGREPVAVGQGRRRLAPEDRRAELVDAAVAVLRAGVDEGNWVAEVTRAAGAAKGTFYLYFASWEEMLAVVRERLIDECDAPIWAALAAGDGVDWWAVLEDQCRRFVDLASEFGRHHALIFHGVLPHDPKGLPRSAPSLLAAAIERGIAEGCFASVDVEVASQLLFAVVHAAADAVVDGGERERWVSACTALARRYLSPPEQRINTPRPTDEGRAPA